MRVGEFIRPLLLLPLAAASVAALYRRTARLQSDPTFSHDAILARYLRLQGIGIPICGALVALSLLLLALGTPIRIVLGCMALAVAVFAAVSVIVVLAALRQGILESRRPLD